MAARSRDYRVRPPKPNTELLGSVIHHICYNELRIPPEETKILVTEDIFTTEKNRNELTALLFDDYEFEGVSYMPQELGSLLGSGRTSGIVVNIGESYTSVVPIYKLNILRQFTQVIPIGGRDCTATLSALLLLRKDLNLYHREHDLTQDVVDDIKEKHAEVAKTATDAMEREVKEITYELPDCQTVNVGRERFLCTEILFSPHLAGKTHPGMTDIISTVISNLRSDLPPAEHEEIIKWVVLTGAGTMHRGLSDRVKEEIARLHEDGIKITAPPERRSIAWMGGSIASSVEGMLAWTMKEEYEEFGPDIIHPRCY
eukprot:sb/3466991/